MKRHFCFLTTLFVTLVFGKTHARTQTPSLSHTHEHTCTHARAHTKQGRGWRRPKTHPTEERGKNAKKNNNLHYKPGQKFTSPLPLSQCSTQNTGHACSQKQSKKNIFFGSPHSSCISQSLNTPHLLAAIAFINNEHRSKATSKIAGHSGSKPTVSHAVPTPPSTFSPAPHRRPKSTVERRLCRAKREKTQQWIPFFIFEFL